MDDSLIDDDRLSIGRKSLLPGTGFFYPDSLDESRADERARVALDGAEVAVVADPDADGLACVALLRAAFGRPEADVPAPTERIELDEDEDDAVEAEDPDLADAAHTVEGEDPGLDGTADDVLGEIDKLRADSVVGLVPAGPGDIDEGLQRVVNFADEGVDVFVCDLCPDEIATVEEELTALLDRAGSVRWFDHHQWDPEVAAAVREFGVDLVVGDSDEECTADVALRSVDYEFPEHLVDLAAATRDHDLWIREDPRSDDLADFAYWIDSETYVETVRAHGADLPATALEYLEQRRIEKEALIERAVERAEFREVGPWTVATTYGRCSQNEVAEALRQDGADASVIVKPAGSASIRGTDSFERCHEVARQVNGGGHPKAAGCKPDVYDDMLDYAHHWTTRGAVASQVILDAFRRLVPEATADETGAASASRDDAGE